MRSHWYGVLRSNVWSTLGQRGAVCFLFLFFNLKWWACATTVSSVSLFLSVRYLKNFYVCPSVLRSDHVKIKSAKTDKVIVIFSVEFWETLRFVNPILFQSFAQVYIAADEPLYFKSLLGKNHSYCFICLYFLSFPSDHLTMLTILNTLLKLV